MSDLAPISTYWSDWHRSLTNQKNSHIKTTKEFRPTCLTKPIVELVINICEELDYSPDIEFACLDTFDLYIDGFYEETMLRYGQILTSILNTEMAGTSSQMFLSDKDAQSDADNWMSEEVYQFKQTLMIRLVSILMLSAKLVGNMSKPTKIKKYCSLLYLLCNKTVVEPHELKATEYKVFSTLNFNIRPSVQFQALEMFVGLAIQIPVIRQQMDTVRRTQLQVGAVQVLRVAYMDRDHIFDIYKDMFGQLDWESTLNMMGNKRSIWMPASAVLAASYICGCTESQCRLISESVVAESSIAFRPLKQLGACLRKLFDTDEEKSNGSKNSDVSSNYF